MKMKKRGLKRKGGYKPYWISIKANQTTVGGGGNKAAAAAEAEADSKPYKVLFPGQRRFSSNSVGPYSFREFNDPRLGLALRHKNSIYEQFGFTDSDSDSDHDHKLDGTPEEDKSLFTDDDDDDDDDDRVVVTRTETVSVPIFTEKEIEDFTMKSKDHSDDDGSTDEVELTSSEDSDVDSDVAEEEKKFRRNMKRRLKDSVKDEAKVLKEMDCECAEAAMRFYNEKYDTDYEIVETLGSYGCLYIGFWFHCNFRAQSKNDSVRGRHSSPRLFFAELYQKQANKLVVNDCKMLDGRGQRGYTVRGCKMCGDQLWHPVNGFKAGRKGQL